MPGRSLLPDLPRPLWVLEGAGFVDTLGTGLALPYLVLYLHDVRGLGFAAAGALLALAGAAGIACGPGFGNLIDRRGPRDVVASALALGAAAYALLAVASSTWTLAIAAALTGVSSAGFWPGHSTLVGRLAPEGRDHVAFSVSALARNAGLGVGAVVGGVIAASAGSGAFTGLLLVDAFSYAACAAVVMTLPAARPSPAGGADDPPLRFRAALGDRALLALVALQMAFVCFTTAAFDFLAPYLTHTAGLDAGLVGLVWLADCLAITVLQLPTGRLVGGTRRMRAIALAGGVWALALVLFGAAGRLHDGAALAIALAGAAVFGLAECLQGPVHTSLVGVLAPPALTGRYQTLLSMSWDVGGLLGPALAGIVFALSPGGFWLVFATGAGLTGVAAIAAERLIPEGARRTPCWSVAAATA
jgi:predicted MFS family arabinose efflux permease